MSSERLDGYKPLQRSDAAGSASTGAPIKAIESDPLRPTDSTATRGGTDAKGAKPLESAHATNAAGVRRSILRALGITPRPSAMPPRCRYHPHLATTHTVHVYCTQAVFVEHASHVTWF